MKNSILKSSIILLLLSFVMYSCNKEEVKDTISLELQGDYRQSNLKGTQYPILDLALDPVVSTGVSDAYAANLTSTGFVLLPTPQDLIVDEQFLDSETGEYYIVRGIVIKGTLMWVPDGDWSSMNQGDVGVANVCANVYALWRWQVR